MICEWQAIESAPRDGTHVDLWVVASEWHRPKGETHRARDCWFEDGQWWEWDDDGRKVTVEMFHRDGRWMWRATMWLPIVPDP
jgi:hypothetical protein